jgi:hypothetical protein
MINSISMIPFFSKLTANYRAILKRCELMSSSFKSKFIQVAGIWEISSSFGLW